MTDTMGRRQDLRASEEISWPSENRGLDQGPNRPQVLQGAFEAPAAGAFHVFVIVGQPVGLDEDRQVIAVLRDLALRWVVAITPRRGVKV